MSPNKKEASRFNLHTHQLERTKKQNKLLMISFIVTGIVIIGLIGYGVLRATVLKNIIPVAVVDGQKIDNEYFQARVRWERNNLVEQYQLLTGNPQLAELYTQQIQQIETLLINPTIFGEYVLNAITRDQLIAIKAKEMGIEVSDQEVDTFIEKFFNYYPEGTPTPDPIPTMFPTPTLSKTQEAILYKPTVTESDTEVEVTAEITVEATAQPTEPVTEPTLTPGPTATAFTDEMFTDLYTSYLSDLDTKNVSEKYIRKIFYYYLINKKVTEAVTADVPHEEEQVWARHILVNTEEEAKNVGTRLKTENWDDVAADVSLDTSNKDNGGDLGWFARGQMVAEFEDTAFGLEIGEISSPVETQFGWHIIQLVDRAVLPLSEADYNNKQTAFYNEWYTGVQDASEIKLNDVWKDIVPADPSLP